jgi:hypothetical protein
MNDDYSIAVSVVDVECNASSDYNRGCSSLCILCSEINPMFLSFVTIDSPNFLFGSF